MTGFLIRLTIGILLLIHGFVHWQITTGWGTQAVAHSRVLDAMGLSATTVVGLGNILWGTALLAFVLAGLVIMMGTDGWQPLAIDACVVSLVVIALFWSPAMAFGALVDLGVLMAVLGLRWPTRSVLGP